MTTAGSTVESVGRQAGRGLRWSLLGTLAMKAGSFAMGLVLARLLAPADFGTYAIALAATNVLMSVNDVGLIAATVQWRGRLAEVAPTATTLTSAFGFAAYGLFWFAAPWFAAIAGDRGAGPVVQLLTLIVLIDGLTAVGSATLMRTFQQDRLILANAGGLVANAAIAITLAMSGAGAFSFAWGQVAGTFLTGVLVVAFARQPVRLGFDRRIAAKLLRFGLPLTASLGIEAMIMNVQFMIIGAITDPVALGHFLLAFNVASWAQSILGTAVRYVSVAGFSRLSEGDDEGLAVGVQRSMSALVTVVAPIAAVTAALAGPLIAFLYGGRWAPAAPVLSLLTVFTLVRIVTGLAMDILMGVGATRATLWVQGGWAAALVPALWAATQLDGIRGAALAHAAVGVLVACPLAALALSRVGVDLARVGQGLVRPLAAALPAGTIAVVGAHLTGPYPVVQLLVAGGAGVLAYLPLAVPRAQLRQWLAMLRRRKPITVLEREPA